MSSKTVNSSIQKPQVCVLYVNTKVNIAFVTTNNVGSSDIGLKNQMSKARYAMRQIKGFVSQDHVGHVVHSRISTNMATSNEEDWTQYGPYGPFETIDEALEAKLQLVEDVEQHGFAFIGERSWLTPKANSAGGKVGDKG